MLNQADVNNNFKGTFYPNSQESLINKTVASNDTSSCLNNEMVKHNTYFQNWGK